jgi:hypothetical protein
MLLMYPHRNKSRGERSGLRDGQGIGPPLTIQASGNLTIIILKLILKLI